MAERALIIGGGHAAGQCAASLRQKGWTGEIVIAGEENYPPYQRPPLSKAYLAGELEAERLLFKPAAFYERENVTLRTGLRAETIDRAGKTVGFKGAPSLEYSRLVIATGARVRRLNCPGSDLEGVGYVRSIADVDALKGRFKKDARIAIIGAGYIGLEVAAVAAKRGLKVAVFEIADRVMSRVTSPAVSHFFEDFHRGHGVDIRLGVGVEAFEGEGSLAAAVLSDGNRAPCDIAVVGIGVVPNQEIAAAAGLATDDGILVDEFTRTKDPFIYAIGDCTRHPSRYFGGLLRLESVHNALEQAKTAAAAVCGEPVAYDEAPWFWSDQYDVKFQTVGVCAKGYDAEVVRGAPSEKKFSVFYLKGEKLIAADSVNAPADHMISRRIIAAGAHVCPEELADPAFDLKQYL